VKPRFTAQADADVVAILRSTLKLIGPRQVRAYAKIIDDGVAMIAANPSRPAAMRRDELGTGVRALHLEHAAGRRGGGAHVLYFTTTQTDGIVVLRVLHEAMEPRRRLMQALRDEVGQEESKAKP
jgi:toxin ParE1/3/4